MDLQNQWLDDGRCRVCDSRTEHTHPFADMSMIPHGMGGMALVVRHSNDDPPIMMRGPHTYSRLWVMRFNTRMPRWNYEWVLCPK